MEHFTDLAHVYLEDSFVLGIDETYQDATHEEDLGNTGSFQYRDGRYENAGDRGQARVTSTAEPLVRFPEKP
ncbi:hypothetical protein [Amycolatopsis sp. cmx-4-83]|uniref:hypothetical protein n=1 Tax=Amycolatopsis sp. cmx-4-83 TaxID=2790940 RepID=UPI00397DACFF